MSMSSNQKRAHARRFFVKKFSLDPKLECMLPGPGAKRKNRNEACWLEFWLTDVELDGLLDEIFEDIQRWEQQILYEQTL